MFRRHLTLRLSRTPLAPAAVGIFAALAILTAFRLPAAGPAWFLSAEYALAALFAVLICTAPAVLAADPRSAPRDIAITAGLFAGMAVLPAPMRLWAVRLGEASMPAATEACLLGLAAAGFLGAVLTHAPRWKTYDARIAWAFVQIGAYWAILAG